MRRPTGSWWSDRRHWGDGPDRSYRSRSRRRCVSAHTAPDPPMQGMCMPGSAWACMHRYICAHAATPPTPAATPPLPGASPAPSTRPPTLPPGCPTSPPLYPFTSLKFTPAGASGVGGPSLPAMVAAYTSSQSTWVALPQFLNVSQGVQIWTVPVTGQYLFIYAGVENPLPPPLPWHVSTSSGDWHNGPVWACFWLQPVRIPSYHLRSMAGCLGWQARGACTSWRMQALRPASPAAASCRPPSTSQWATRSTSSSGRSARWERTVRTHSRPRPKRCLHAALCA